MFQKVYDIVSQIPKGKVMTYGQIGKLVPCSAQLVGFALHANKLPESVPCHRVVNKEGRVAPGYAFGGSDIQKKLLVSEGVTFTDDTHVDLVKYRYEQK